MWACNSQFAIIPWSLILGAGIPPKLCAILNHETEKNSGAPEEDMLCSKSFTNSMSVFLNSTTPQVCYLATRKRYAFLCACSSPLLLTTSRIKPRTLHRNVSTSSRDPWGISMTAILPPSAGDSPSSSRICTCIEHETCLLNLNTDDLWVCMVFQQQLESQRAQQVCRISCSMVQETHLADVHMTVPWSLQKAHWSNASSCTPECACLVQWCSCTSIQEIWICFALQQILTHLNLQQFAQWFSAVVSDCVHRHLQLSNVKQFSWMPSHGCHTTGKMKSIHLMACIHRKRLKVKLHGW